MPCVSFPSTAAAPASAVAAPSVQVGPDQGHLTGHVMSCPAEEPDNCTSQYQSAARETAISFW